MKNLKTNLIALVALSISGCATTKNSSLLGASIGAGAGLGAGVVMHPGSGNQDRAKNLFMSLAVGSLLGAGIGYLVHDDEKKSSSLVEGNTAVYSGGPGEPALIPAEVETRFVDDQVKGGTFVPGHFQYRIKKPTQWKK